MSSTESDDDGRGVVERFQPTSGRVSGIVGLVVGGAILLLGVHGMTQGDYRVPVLVVLATLLGLVLVWAALLRPALWATEHDLVMRNMFHTDHIPLAAIEKVVVTQVLAVSAGDRRLVSPVVGFSARQNVRERFRAGGLEHQQLDAMAGRAERRRSGQHQRLVEQRITQLADDARLRRDDTSAGVRREWAWPTIAASVALTLAIVVWLLVR